MSRGRGWIAAGVAACTLVFASAAAAEQRTITVKLLGGQVLSFTIDLPAGTLLGDIPLPQLNTPIVGVLNSKPGAQPAASAPAGTAAEATKKKHKHSEPKAAAHVVTPAEREKAVRKARSARPGVRADGTPTTANPTFSYALPGPAPIGVPNFFIDKFRIPPFLLPIYQAAGIQYGIRWEILAAINEIETDYGRNLNVSTAGATGWMQFLPSTWKRYGVDANNDGRKDMYNPVDAIFAAARYLRAAGADTDVRKAIYAYNHAGWYVDSVLMRARLIGGLPVDLVGSLTGLTEGRFPVDAAATYAGATSAADATTHRVARGSNASITVAGSAARRQIAIFAKPGSRVIAVQDGKVVRMGQTPQLGRFVQLRDVYGNTYTYAGLGTLAHAHAVPKDRRIARRVFDMPRRDKAPTAAASAGTQRTGAVAKARPAVLVATTKQRLFAHPRHAIAPRGLRRYLAGSAGIDPKQVRIVALKPGSRVIAGTVLGRLGVTHQGVASHVSFRIRPAGKGAPLIDPKPILDGWKLLESTAIYRAAGRNPLFGADARNPSIGQLLLMSKQALQRRVLDDPNIDLYSCGRQDISAGAIDRRVLAALEFLSAGGLRPTVSALRCGHSLMTTSGNISEHSSGNAVDISKINGISIAGHQGPGSITDITIRRLLTLQGTMKPHQIISLMTFTGTDNTLALPDHADHIHIGYRPLYDGSARGSLAAVLKPAQWSKLIARLDTITNPVVPLPASGD